MTCAMCEPVCQVEKPTQTVEEVEEMLNLQYKNWEKHYQEDMKRSHSSIYLLESVPSWNEVWRVENQWRDYYRWQSFVANASSPIYDQLVSEKS